MQTVIQTFVAAGVVAIPLLLFSLAAIALIIERGRFWFRVNRTQRKVVDGFLNVFQHDPSHAPEYLKRHIHLPMARIFLAAISLEAAKPDELALAIDGAIQAEIPVLKRFNNIFDTIVTLSPLLGLLGTVLGLIRAFSSLSLGEMGGARSAMVTSGISEALVSTAFGLIVAVVTLFFANTFRGFYMLQIAMIQEYAASVELIYRHHRRTHHREEAGYATTRH